MVSLIHGSVDYSPVEADENVVRRNTAPVDAAQEAAEIDHDPHFNELAVDSNPDIGLTTRQLGSRWYPSVKGVRDYFHAIIRGQNTANQLVNAQVSTSGTAAAREEAGEFGHGTMAYAVGIEPLNPAGAFGTDYFAVTKPHGPNPTTTTEVGVRAQAGMSGEREQLGRQAAQGKDAARDASSAAMYAAFLGRITG